jgi:DNA-binding transcriptional ArsR family regulator
MKDPNPSILPPESSLAGQREVTELSHFASLLGVLANENRLKILRLLLRNYPRGLAPAEISGELSIPPAEVQTHLVHLRGEMVVLVEPGRPSLYSACTAILDELLAFLYYGCCAPTPAVMPVTPIKLSRGS